MVKEMEGRALKILDLIVDEYIRTGVCSDPETKALIDMKHEKNKFKLELMPCFEFRP